MGPSVLERALARVAAGPDPVASFNNYAGIGGATMVARSKAMDFAGALGFLKRGRAVRRTCWGLDPDAVIRLNPGGELTLGELTLVVQTDRITRPWHPTQADVLAEDWVEVRPMSD